MELYSHVIDARVREGRRTRGWGRFPFRFPRCEASTRWAYALDVTMAAFRYSPPVLKIYSICNVHGRFSGIELRIKTQPLYVKFMLLRAKINKFGVKFVTLIEYFHEEQLCELELLIRNSVFRKNDRMPFVKTKKQVFDPPVKAN